MHCVFFTIYACMRALYDGWLGGLFRNLHLLNDLEHAGGMWLPSFVLMKIQALGERCMQAEV